MSRLTNNSLPCERARGLVFSETMRSASDVVANGGSITDTTFSDGWADFNGTSSDIEYDFANQGGQAGVTFTSWVDAGTLPTSGYHRFIRIETTGVTNSNFYAGLYYTGGQLYIQGGAIMGGGHSAYIKAVSLSDNQIFHFAFRCDGTNMEAFVNGVSLGTQSNSGTWAGGNEFHLGSFSGASEFFAGKLKDPKFWLVALTDQEIADFANNETYNYMNEAVLNLPMRMEDHDPTNVRTLDVSGNDNHATFGDGSTSSTYPTKLTKRGYSFDTTDYMKVTSSDSVRITGDLTMAVCYRKTSWSSDSAFINKRDGYQDNESYGLAEQADGDIGIQVSQTGSTQINHYSTLDANNKELKCIVGVIEVGVRMNNYLNGEQVGTTKTSGVPSSIHDSGASTHLNINAYNNPPTASGDCEIYWVGMWAKALTPLQIADLNIRLRKQLNDI